MGTKWTLGIKISRNQWANTSLFLDMLFLILELQFLNKKNFKERPLRRYTSKSSTHSLLALTKTVVA